MPAPIDPLSQVLGMRLGMPRGRVHRELMPIGFIMPGAMKDAPGMGPRADELPSVLLSILYGALDLLVRMTRPGHCVFFSRCDPGLSSPIAAGAATSSHEVAQGLTDS